MGIGLVDPILKPIADELGASPSQTSLLFTSYMAEKGLAMLVTGVVSTRIGAKYTLLAGLALIIVFAALAGSSDTVGAIVGFRAGWGLGNALFIATALATIVASARGSVAQSVILFEAALGLGIAMGPVVGGQLGEISWRAPFSGVAVLMAIALVATTLFLPRTPVPARRTSLADPFRALRHSGLLTVALTALFYNMGFFTLLAFTPFPLDLSAARVGWIFFGWGLLLAVTSVWVAPWLESRFGVVTTALGSLSLFALDLVAMALWTDSKAVLVLGVIAAGAFLGVNNTVITQAVMGAAPSRSRSSSSRPPWAWASPPGRSSAASSARSAGGRPSSAWPC
ncbi:MAG: MFS transporter [Actinomycetes bacterium]